ncbi:circadian clock protein KaiA [Waterburya agarophytonicola K14]|uniref:Circadian clock oscillator protein KaiA n=1 Tax=Waterburya agarophytonicola KI4 TaxID=2874699 RepID=A0A964BRV0_9CYAN|nr:circadian clock protein KaiA [Waterburya agarophytonicola]MCC0177622.1 circadian clock protein KaiA [Waterburya agarophytonicola KI4]
MSDYQNQHFSSNCGSVSTKLQICLFSTQPQFTQSVAQLLNSDRYELKCFSLTEELVNFTTDHKEQIDCIVLVNNSKLGNTLEQLWQSKMLFPIVIVETDQPSEIENLQERESEISFCHIDDSNIIYHQAEICLYPTQLKEISSYINLAITKFISLTPNSKVDDFPEGSQPDLEQGATSSLITQQRRLTNKIKERLGYLGVYYKRNVQDFYRNLSSQEQTKLLNKLSLSYRTILLNYFEDNSEINQLIDEFVDRAFFADVSTSQILEIHMDLIDEFSHQLRLEGRNDDILLDYRLALIDVIAHLCEMYRRSIPGEDISLKLLFGVE